MTSGVNRDGDPSVPASPEASEIIFYRTDDDFLKLSERDVLDHPSAITHDAAADKARQELDRYDAARARLAAPVELHFDDAVRAAQAIAKRRPAKPKKPTP